MTFSELGLSPPLIKALHEKGYDSPTAIQRKAIPSVLDGNDVLATAQTGTGKTASFVVPLLQMLAPERRRRAKRMRALVLVPTRELAFQVERNIREYGKYVDVHVTALVGGLDYAPQKNALIEGVDIVVATPGRLLDLAHQRALHFDEVKHMVLDEADRMLDMGFVDDIEKIINSLPSDRQDLLFSATVSGQVRDLAQAFMDQAHEILLTKNQTVKAQISQWVVAIDKHNKSALLSSLIQENEWTQALIFIRTQHGAAKLVSQLDKRGIVAECLHGGRSQASRTQILADFKAGRIQFLVATGIAARGLDIDDLERVVNYDLPDDAEEYIHRIGRTGRAAASGEAVSLVSKDDFKRLCAIERKQDKIIERRRVDGFSVVKDLPPSNLNFVLKKGPKN